MGGPDMAPHTPPRSGRPGEAVAPLDDAFRVRALLDDALRARAVTNLTAFERRALPVDGRRPAAVAVVLLSDDAGRACFLLTPRAACSTTIRRARASSSRPWSSGAAPIPC